MRVPRVRFTVRRLMIAVAVAGLVCSLPEAMERRRLAFTGMSNYHFNKLITLSKSTNPQYAYHYKLHLKYYEASKRPWLPVWPDPPEPK